MAVRPLLRFPDPRLQQVAAAVAEFDAALAELAGDLLDTLRAAGGIGIAAPHVGVMRRVVVLALPGDKVRIYVNPAIVSASDSLARHMEGSIAMPGASETVERPARVRVDYRDLAGVAHSAEADGLLAVCLQHEIDQLDGIFWTRRLSPLRRDRVVKRYLKSVDRA